MNFNKRLRLADKITVLHEMILQFFIEKREIIPFYFTLRTPRNDEQGRLKNCTELY
jgi:hypothetical protein